MEAHGLGISIMEITTDFLGNVQNQSVLFCMLANEQDFGGFALGWLVVAFCILKAVFPKQ